MFENMLDHPEHRRQTGSTSATSRGRVARKS
jgi:hypothetical protein